MILLLIAVVAFLLPNSFLVYWLLFEFDGLGQIIHNPLAIGFIIDVFVTMCLLAYYFARKPIGKVSWPWFVALSLAGGVAFSLPLYFWLNRRSTP